MRAVHTSVAVIVGLCCLWGCPYKCPPLDYGYPDGRYETLAIIEDTGLVDTGVATSVGGFASATMLAGDDDIVITVVTDAGATVTLRYHVVARRQ